MNIKAFERRLSVWQKLINVPAPVVVPGKTRGHLSIRRASHAQRAIRIVRVQTAASDLQRVPLNNTGVLAIPGKTAPKSRGTT